MDFALIAKSLGTVALLIDASMAMCLPRTLLVCSGSPAIDWNAIDALAASVAIAVLLGTGLLRVGRGADGRMFRKAALAVVGMSWCLLSFLMLLGRLGLLPILVLFPPRFWGTKQ